MRRWLVIGAAALVALLAAGEIAVRVFIGQSPLYVTHPTVEYENAPDQAVTYRGARIETNAFGMRSPPVSAGKPADSFRVLVMGDSVVFGHVFTSQADLATTHLNALRLPDGRRVETLNVAANSWGPGNMLAWLEAHGDFSADAAVLVLSSHDLVDDRDFATLSEASRPTRRWPVALLDVSIRRLLKTPVAGAAPGRIEGDARASLPVLLGRLAALPQGACMIVHEETAERASPEQEDGVAELHEAAYAAGVQDVADRDHVGEDGYRDNIHLSPAGQRGLAQAMLECGFLKGAT